MTAFVVRRTAWMLGVLFVVSLITFTLMHAVPGGPFSLEKALPQAAIDQLNRKYNLDAPLHLQYLDYVGDIVLPVVTTGEQSRALDHEYLINIKLPLGDDATLRWMNFGPSFKSTSRTVNDIFRDNLPISFQLGIAAFVVSVGIGIPLGAIAAIRRNTLYDYSAVMLALVGVSVPVIITAPLLQYIFGVRLRWLPVTGWGEFQHYLLPALALGFAQSALLARLTRASLLQVLNEDYIRTARAKGLHERRVLALHMMKNGMIPIATVFGPTLAYLVTGTFVIETVFGIPGMGKFFVTSITGRDYPVIMGTILLFAVFLVIANMLVDIVYLWLDPRISYR